MPNLHLFTDGSVHTQSKFGMGAYLLLSDINTPIESLQDKVNFKAFYNTSSTKLELQTLLWALNTVSESKPYKGSILTIYTDSQNIITLPARKSRLELNNYISRNHKQLANAELYQEFYRLSDYKPQNTSKDSANSYASNKYTFVKVKGHKISSKKSQIDLLFSLVDQVARRRLRENIRKCD
jgi:ribonuclease HI